MTSTKEQRMTTNAIATIGPRDYTPEQVALIKSQIAPGASDAELQLFVAVSKQLGLDPFKRQLYAIQRSGKMTIQVSVDGLLAIAERSREFAGVTAPQFCGDDGAWRDVWLKGTPAAAKIGVLRRGWREPVWGIAVMREYVQDNSMWKTKPTHMLEKCALAKALRRAFPNEFSEVSEATADYADDWAVDTETGEVTYDDGLAASTDAPEPPTMPVQAAEPPKADPDAWKAAAAACWTQVKAWAGEHEVDPNRLRYYLATAAGVPEKLTEKAFKVWLDSGHGKDFDFLYRLYVEGESNGSAAAAQAELEDGEQPSMPMDGA